MDLENKQISVALANKLAEALKGKSQPTIGRVLICTPKGENKTKGGILIPGTTSDKDLPRKGVVIQKGYLEQLHDDMIPVGTLVTYGMYAGKEIEPNKEFFAKELPTFDMDNYKFTILSESEIVYLETNE